MSRRKLAVLNNQLSNQGKITFSEIFSREAFKEELRHFNKSFLDGINKKGEVTTKRPVAQSGMSRQSSAAKKTIKQNKESLEVQLN